MLNIFTKTPDLAIHTPTLDGYIKIVNHIIHSGYRWGSGRVTIREYFWDKYGNNTCITVEDMVLYFCSCSYCFRNRVEIISIREFYNRIKYDDIIGELI